MTAPKIYECPIQGHMSREEILKCTHLHDGNTCYAQADIMCSPRLSSDGDVLRSQHALSSPSCKDRVADYSLNVDAWKVTF